MEKMNLVFEDELLINPKFHDAEILSISDFDFKTGVLGMKLQTEDGQDWHVWFRGVSHLNVDDLFHQNVVFGISVYRNGKITQEYKDIIQKFCYADKDIHKLMLVELDSASGANISIICENFEIFKMDT